MNGENQNGKTTILDAITYITHGTTLATNKLGGAQREKNGDNRYINNKRNLDYCEGGMVINVNGDLYTLVRRTERKMARDKKTISSCSTTLEYYDGSEPNTDKKLVGERRTNTQTKIDSIIGDFEDFIRLTLTNSENLNYLISLDRATFIDSIIRDAGYDIFEKKLNEFKEYKKELSTERIEINLNDAEEKVEDLKNLLQIYKSKHDEIKKNITEIDDKLKVIGLERDEEFKKLNKIDDDIANIDIDSIKSKIDEYKKTININLSQQKINSDKQKGLKKEYDKEKYESLLKEIKKIEDDILNLKLNISQEETKIEKEKSNILRVDDKIRSLKQKEIDAQKSKLIIINNDIEKISAELDSAIETKKRDIKDQQKTQDFKIKTLTTEIKNLKEKVLGLKEQIKILEETENCPTCGALPEHQKHKTNKIAELQSEIATLLNKGKDLQVKLNNAKIDAEKIQKKINDLDSGIYPEDIKNIERLVKDKLEKKKKEIDLINSICEEIKSNNFANTPDLKTSIDMGLQIKTTSENTIKTIENNIKNIKQNIKDKENEKSKKQSEVSIIEKDKEEVKTYETLSQENKELSLKIENIKLIIENAKTKIDKYYEQLKYIDENKVIETKISEYDCKISELNSEKTNLNENLAEIMKEAAVTKTTIQDIQNNIKKYQEQVKR